MTTLSTFILWWWGFYAHREINQAAIYTLPPEMAPFFKTHAHVLVDWAVRPDQRRYAVDGEAPRHFIDWDVYSPTLKDSLFRLPWSKAVNLVTEDTLQAYGIVPWHVISMKNQLTKAFSMKNTREILRLSAEIGHYIGDANVPLHTTQNYNGQMTGQTGIHGFWESRLPELFATGYSRWVGPAHYLEKPDSVIWQAVHLAHVALDSVLLFEKELTRSLGNHRKFEVTERNRQTIRTYSDFFSNAYHRALDGQVERHFKRAIRMTGDFWYTAWVDAGQPDLSSLLPYQHDPTAEKDLVREWLRNLRRVAPPHARTEEIGEN